MLHLSASKYLSNKLLFIDLLSKMADQLHRWALRKLLYDTYKNSYYYFQPKIEYIFSYGKIAHDCCFQSLLPHNQYHDARSFSFHHSLLAKTSLEDIVKDNFRSRISLHYGIVPTCSIVQ